MKLIVGLGNPGAAYEPTRHNVGFEVVRRIARTRHVHVTPFKAGGTVVALHGALGSDTIVMMPQLMMNHSGDAVVAMQRSRETTPSEILIVCDDVNLPVGTLRLRPSGGAGGHHGLLSCLEHLQTEDVPRLRIGVGRDSLPRDLTEFVLSPFDPEERPLIERAIEQAVEACEVWRSQGIEIAMNRVNMRPSPDE